jgi:tetratricopeptide (TPR) repeat protein
MNRALTLLFLALAGCSSPEQARKSALEKGLSFVESNKLDDAEIQFKRSLEADPNFAEAHFRLGQLTLKRMKLAEAFESFQKAHELDQNRSEYSVALADLGLFLFSANNGGERYFNAASKAAGTLLSANPESYDGLRLTAYLRLLEKKDGEALSLYRRAQAANADEVEVAVAIARLLDGQKKSEEGTKEAEAFLAKHPASKPAYDYLYMKYLSQNKPEEAEKIAQRREQHLPKNARTSLELCAHYASQKKNDQARACAKSVAKRFSGDPEAALSIARFHVEFNSPEEALGFFEEASKGNESVRRAALLEAGKVLGGLRRNDEAIAKANAVLKESPNLQEAAALKARLLLIQGGAEDRESALKTFQDLSSRNTLYRLDLAKIHLAKGDPKAARENLVVYLNSYPRDTATRELLASIHDREKDFTALLEESRILSELQPGNPTAGLFRTRALMGLGRLSEAKTQIAKQLAADPNATEPLMQQAFVALAESKYDVAEAAFRRLYKPGQKDRRALMGLVETSILKKQPEAAIKLLQTDLAQAQEPEETRLLLATTASRLGKFDLAIEHYEKAIEKQPTSSVLLLALGETQRRKGDAAASQATLQKAGALDPKSSAAQAGLGLQQLDAGNTQAAEKFFREAIAKNPGDVASRNNLAFLLAGENRNLDEALRYAQEAVAKAPGNPIYSDTLAYVHLKRKNYDAALSIWNKLTAAAPQVAEYQIHMAQAHLEKGDTVAARNRLAAAEKLPLSAADKKALEQLRARIR